MRLSAEQFAELVAVLRSDRAQPRRQHEKRRCHRIAINASIPIELILDGRRSPAIDVTVRDFSTRGMCLLYHSPLENGQQFICILRRHSGGHVALLCTVVQCRRLTDKFFGIGAEFTCTLAHATTAYESAETARIRQSVLD
jgi:hypothetical protein